MKKFSTWLKKNADITKHYWLMHRIFGGYQKDLDILVRDYILQEYSPNLNNTSCECQIDGDVKIQGNNCSSFHGGKNNG